MQFNKKESEKLINHFLAVNYDLTGNDLDIANMSDVLASSIKVKDEVFVNLEDCNGLIGSFNLSEDDFIELIGNDERRKYYGALLVNMAQTPDGTLIQSKSHYNFVEHIDKDGKLYFIDGGLSYSRRSAGLVDRCLNYGDDHAVIRKHFKWGSRGVDGLSNLSWISLESMNKDHIESIVDGGHGSDVVRQLMKDELEWREDNVK